MRGFSAVEALVVFVLVVLIGGIIWWNVTHKCVRYHDEVVERCDTHTDAHGRRTTTHCRMVLEPTCDEWVER